MLSILEQKNFASYQDQINPLALPPDTDLHLSEAVNDQHEVMGWILYAYEPEQVQIYAMEDHQDWNYCDGLVRSVLFKAQLRGLNKAEFHITDPSIRERLGKLHFVKTDQNIIYDIMDIMENCKKCKENPANT